MNYVIIGARTTIDLCYVSVGASWAKNMKSRFRKEAYLIL